jgi:quercetin dioxygenase-like cupin family protein
MNHPDAPIAFLSNREDAPAYWQVDILWLIHASVQQTGGAYSLIEEFCPKDSGPPPHYHDQDEGFYLLEGEITFQAGDQILKAQDGFSVSIPRGTVHSFRVDSEVAHILNFYTPGGFEQIIVELGQPALTRTLPPLGIDQTISPDRMKAALQKVGMHVVDLPDSLRL